jgi:hypothetical protein
VRCFVDQSKNQGDPFMMFNTFFSGGGGGSQQFNFGGGGAVVWRAVLGCSDNGAHQQTAC